MHAKPGSKDKPQFETCPIKKKDRQLEAEFKHDFFFGQNKPWKILGQKNFYVWFHNVCYKSENI